MSPSEGTRRRLRSNHACLNCRRKKTRCPGEKPACSCCVRLNQSCFYMPAARPSSMGGQSDRLAELEEKVNLILNRDRPRQATQPEQAQPASELEELSETSLPVGIHAAPGTQTYTANDPFASNVAFDDSSPQPSSSAIAAAIDLYLEHCHRQPVWCFDFEEPGELGCLPEELVCSILALTLRFVLARDQGKHYADTAKSLIMPRIVNGTVDLTTIETLCLLAYSSFIDRYMEVGRFYLGLAFQLSRSAMLDVESTYTDADPQTERKKRLFWSLQLLEQSYGRQTGLLSIPTETWRPPYFFSGGDKESHNDSVPKPPPLPRDTIGCSALDDTGIWCMTIHFGWVWSKVRTYVSDCASNRLREPWRHESMYSVVLSDLTEIENRTPLCHRYDYVQFYERQPDELMVNRAYWVPWLKLQFTYHAILTVLNHPFLYIIASQHNPNLAIPNSFWRRSSELVVLHATWIVRMIDMVSEKEMRLMDPFFAHAAAIAATVQLYYCCAGDPRLKQKSRADLAKCREFLKAFVPFSRACEALNETLDEMVRIASGSEIVDYEDWSPSKIHLNIPLMWDILQFNGADQPEAEMPHGGLLHPSLTAAVVAKDTQESPTLEIIVTTSPEVTVNTTDGGQAVPMPLYMKATSSSPNAPEHMALRDKLVAPIDSLMFNTPWLWADSTQFGDVNDLGNQNSAPALGDVEGSAWWNLGNL